MQVDVYLMRKNGFEVQRELLGDEAQNIEELCIGVIDDGPRKKPVKAARLQRDNGDVIFESLDVQIEAIKVGAWC